MKVKKGDHGYIKAQKKKQILITLLLFAVPLAIFFTGWHDTGTRKNWFTFIAILGCLPACKSAVGMIMILMQKPPSDELCTKIKEKAGTLTICFDLSITAYEKNTPIVSAVVCGNTVVGYTESKNADCSFVEKTIRETLKDNGYKVSVKIFKDLNPYLDRLASLEKNKEELKAGIKFTPDERYPDLSREELIKHTILAISL